MGDWSFSTAMILILVVAVVIFVALYAVVFPE
jgi:hypothetical protein